MKAKIACFVIGLFMSVGLQANHILGGNISYACLGGDQYLFTLTIYKDCFGATPAPGIENVFFIPDAGCSSIAFSAPFDLVSVTEISDLCASELANSSCNGGFNPGTEAVVYQQTISLDPNCVWEVSYGSSDWNYFVNMDNALLPTAYLSTSVDTNFGCNSSVEITSDPVPYACVNDPVSHFLAFNNPDGFTLNVSLVGAEIANGVDAPYEAGFTFGEPIPGLTFDPATYEIAFTAPATFGNYVVVFEIEMVDAMGNVVGTVVEAMTFTVRVCDNLPTTFETPPLSAVIGGTQLSDTELEICVGDTICFDVEAVNDNPFRSVTVSSSNLGTLFANVDAVSVPGNPGSLDVCISPTDAEIGLQVIDFEAIDDACVNPGSDNISITLEVLPKLEVNFTDSLICYGEQIALQASGDTDYTWNVISGTSTPAISGTGGTQTIIPDTPLLIEVIGNNAPPLQCNWRDTISVDVSLYDLGAVVVDESCVQNDGSVTLTVTGGVGPFDYAWDVTADNVAAVTGLSGGSDVNVTVTDTAFPGAAGCTRSETYPIATTPPPTASITGDVTICSGESYDIPVTLTGTGPFDVTVSGTLYNGLNDGDVITVTPATTTTYTLTLAEDANTPACTYNTPSSVTVTVRDIPAASLTGNTDLCAGESTDLTFNTVPPGLTLDVQGNDAALNAQLTDGDVLTFTPGVPGTTTYTLTEVAYTDAPSCPNTTPSSVVVNVNTSTTGTVGFTGASTICAGDAVVLRFELAGSGPWIIDYTIDGTAQTAINTALDVYDLLISPGPVVDTEYCITQITDVGTGCVNTTSSCVTLTVNTLPTGTVSTTGPFCAGDAVDLTLNFTGNGPMDVTLTDPAGGTITVAGPYNDGDVITVPNAETGDYCLGTVTDANGCTAAGLPNCSAIVVSPLPSATVLGSAVICAGDNYDFNWSGLVGTAPFEVSWELLATDGVTVVDSGTATGVNNGDILTLTPTDSVTFQITGISDATPGLCGDGAQAGTFDLAVNPYTTIALPASAVAVCQGETVPVTLTFGNAVGPALQVDLGTEVVNLTTADLDASGQYTFDATYDTSLPGTGSITIASVTDAGNPCTQIDLASVDVTVVETPVATFAGDFAVCPGTGTDLTLGVPLTGGPYDVVITNDAGDPDITLVGVNGNQSIPISPAATTTYTVTSITETGSGIGCANTTAETVTVTVNTLPTIVQPIDTICSNNGDAFQVSFEIIGGTPATYTVTTTDGYAGTISAGPPYIYTSDNIPDNTAQTWTVTDAASCDPESITLDAFDCPVLTFAGTVDENPLYACEGGIVCLTQNGDEVLDDDDVLSFALLDGPDLATAAILDIQPGNCWDLAMLAFPPFATGDTYYAVALAGNNDGTGVADVTDPNLNVSPSVEVLFVEDPVATITGGQTICNGTSTELSVAITGTGSFDLTYSDPAGTATELLGLEAADLPVTFDANQAGDYAVTVISSYGCPGAAGSTTTVNFFPAINGSISAGGAICEGEVFTFEIGLEGDANWSIELEFDSGTASGTTTESDLTTSPFVWLVNQPGTYSLLSATDANGCTETYTNGEALVVNTLPTAAWQETAINFCEGGSSDALVDLTGPADYTLNYSIDAVAQPALVTSDTPYTLTGISATGTYTIDTVTDANGCTAAIDQDLVVTEVLLPTADAGADQNICSDEEVLIGTPAEGGNAYDWTVDSGDVVNWLNNTTAAEPTASITNTDAPNLATYTFTVTVTEPVASCTSTDDVVVTVNPVPTAEAGLDANICYGDTFTLNGAGDGSCAWTDNGAFAAGGDLLLCAPTTAALTATTTFELTITSAAGCTNTDEVTITVPDELTQSVVFDDVVCFASCTAEATITPVGGWGAYVITGDVTDASTTDLCAGVYNYTITDAEGCAVDGSFEVTEQPEYYIDDVIVDAPNCFGEQDGELEIQTVGGVEYFLDGTSSITNTFSDLGAGTYLVEVTNLNGCTADTTVTIDTNSPEITLDVNFTNTVVCFDQALEFIATAGGGVGDFTYNWYQDAPPPGTIYDVGSPLEVVMDEELLLFVVAYDANGCPSDTLSMEAVFSTPVSVSASPTTAQTICIGQCVDVNAIPAGGTGPIEVTWVEDGIFDDDLIGNDPNYTLCPEESINFVVFADDGCAPVASDTVFVTVNPAPDVEFTLDVDFGCLPLEVNFINETPDASTTCFWDFGDGTILNVCEDVTYVYEEAGTFFPSLNITSDQGCTGTDLSLTPVNVYGFPEADFYWDPVPVTTLENEVSLINTSTGGVSYLWEIAGNGTATTEDVEITFAPVDLAEYEVCLQTTNMFGCTDTLCQTISMQSELLVYVPNAFTPDNDGLNDLLTPSVLGLLQSTYHFQVFDRWGHIVFESYTVGEGWNGSFQNGSHYVQEDVYLWRIEGQDVKGADVVTLQGHVTVVR